MIDDRVEVIQELQTSGGPSFLKLEILSRGQLEISVAGKALSLR